MVQDGAWDTWSIRSNAHFWRPGAARPDFDINSDNNPPLNGSISHPLVHPARETLTHLRHDMPVDLERGGDAFVPELSLDGIGIGAVRQVQCGVGVAKDVRADP